MKKIIISNYDDINNPYYGGGGAIIIHKLAKRLQRYYHVEIITGTYPGAKNQLVDNVKYQRIGTSFFGPKLGQLIFHFSLMVQIINKKKFDVWLENFTPPFSTSCLQLFTPNPVIGLVHMLSGEDMYRKYKFPFQFIEYFGLKTYQYLIVLTKIWQEKIHEINPNAMIEIIPNGIDKNDYLFKQDNHFSKKHILFINRIEINQKGIDLLLKAYKLINSRYKLVIAGSGNPGQVKYLKKIINHLNLEKIVVLPGKVESSQKLRLFNNALFTVIPSRFETFSLVALESMLAKKPIIAFDINGMKWIPKTCCLKVKPYDIRALAKAMEKLTTNKSERAVMGHQGWLLSKQFSWDITLDKYLSYIKRVIS